MTQTTLPALSLAPHTSSIDDTADLDDTLPPDLDFTPVPRHSKQERGLNARKQRRFIIALSACGSVTMAARSVGHSGSPFYQLRKAAGAESFAAAWDRAVDQGARRVLDTLMDHAIHGTPEQIIQNGDTVLERRRYNHRAMMWIVAHHFPDTFGGVGGLGSHGGLSVAMEKLKEKWHAEWEAEAGPKIDIEMVRQGAANDRAAAFEQGKERLLALYARKCSEEHNDRRSGNFASADFTMRQLIHMETLLETAGYAVEIVKKAFYGERPNKIGNVTPAYSSPFTRELAAHRHAVWAKESPALIRPHEALWPDGLPECSTWGGPTERERWSARADAERRIAAAQAEWEACYNEERWAAWKARE